MADTKQTITKTEMRKGPILIAVLVTAIVVAGGMYLFQEYSIQKKNEVASDTQSGSTNTNATAAAPVNQPDAAGNQNTNTATNTNTAAPTTNTNTPNNIKLFFVALGDEGKTGEEIGCDDSLIPVETAVSNPTAALTSAMEQLLAQKDKYYGKSGLYNALYQSNLKVDTVEIDDDIATVRLSGTYTIGGACDRPRFEAQLTRTAEQFSEMERVDILINGAPLDDILSSD